jgi:hypothetical protein
VHIRFRPRPLIIQAPEFTEFRNPADSRGKSAPVVAGQAWPTFLATSKMHHIDADYAQR